MSFGNGSTTRRIRRWVPRLGIAVVLGPLVRNRDLIIAVVALLAGIGKDPYENPVPPLSSDRVGPRVMSSVAEAPGLQR